MHVSNHTLNMYTDISNLSTATVSVVLAAVDPFFPPSVSYGLIAE